MLFEEQSTEERRLLFRDAPGPKKSITFISLACLGGPTKPLWHAGKVKRYWVEDSVEQQQELDRITSAAADAGERLVGPDNLTEQPLVPKDERIVSANPYSDAATIGPARDVTHHPESSDAVVDLATVYPQNVYASHEQTIYFGGYDNSTGYILNMSMSTAWKFYLRIRTILLCVVP